MDVLAPALSSSARAKSHYRVSAPAVWWWKRAEIPALL